MQKLNCFLVVCAMAASVSLVPMSHAQDNEAQAKARQALREKLDQLDGSATVSKDTEAQAKAREVLRKQSNQAPPSAVPQPSMISQPAPKPAPVMITMAPAVAPAVAAADAQNIEKARQAVRQELDRLSSSSPDSPEVAKAREAMRQKLAESPQPAGNQNVVTAARAQTEAQTKAEKAAQLEADKAEAAAKAERTAKRNAKLAPNAFQPIEAPALPVSNEKQQRLAELLQKYRADQVTPEQHHLERAKILAEQ